MKSTWKIGIAATMAGILTTALAAPMTLAQQKHDSNTLHKIGKAIQYPVNKSAQNASVDVHRAEGRKSVEHRRNGNRTHDTVVTPKGHLHRIRHHGHHHSM